MFFDYFHSSSQQTQSTEEQPFFKPAPVVSEHFFAGKTMTQTASSGTVQRQKKPLAGMQPSHTIDYRTESKVDAALQQSPTVSPYIQAKLNAGLKVQGNVTYYTKRKEFEQKRAGIGNSTQSYQSVQGFYNYSTGSIHLPPSPKLESLLHEAIHQFSSDFRTFGYINEGLTQLFTNIVLAENGLSKGSAYPVETKIAEAIRDKIGLNKLAQIFFSGKFEDLDNELAKSIPRYNKGTFRSMIIGKETAKLLQYLK